MQQTAVSKPRAMRSGRAHAASRAATRLMQSQSLGSGPAKVSGQMQIANQRAPAPAACTAARRRRRRRRRHRPARRPRRWPRRPPRRRRRRRRAAAACRGSARRPFACRRPRRRRRCPAAAPGWQRSAPDTRRRGTRGTHISAPQRPVSAGQTQRGEGAALAAAQTERGRGLRCRWESPGAHARTPGARLRQPAPHETAPAACATAACRRTARPAPRAACAPGPPPCGRGSCLPAPPPAAACAGNQGKGHAQEVKVGAGGGGCATTPSPPREGTKRFRAVRHSPTPRPALTNRFCTSTTAAPSDRETRPFLHPHPPSPTHTTHREVLHLDHGRREHSGRVVQREAHLPA